MKHLKLYEAFQSGLLKELEAGVSYLSSTPEMSEEWKEVARQMGEMLKQNYDEIKSQPALYDPLMNQLRSYLIELNAVEGGDDEDLEELTKLAGHPDDIYIDDEEDEGPPEIWDDTLEDDLKPGPGKDVLAVPGQENIKMKHVQDMMSAPTRIKRWQDMSGLPPTYGTHN